MTELGTCAFKTCRNEYDLSLKLKNEIRKKLVPILKNIKLIRENTNMPHKEAVVLLKKEKNNIDQIMQLVLEDKRNFDYYKCTLERCLKEHKREIAILLNLLNSTICKYTKNKKDTSLCKKIQKEFTSMLTSQKIPTSEYLTNYSQMMKLLHP